MPVPTGSTWLVLPFQAPGSYDMPHKVWGVRYYTTNTGVWEGMLTGVDEFPPGTLVLAGDTRVDKDRRLTPADLPEPCQFVEVLLPRRCWINSLHFDSKSASLRRVS